MDTESNAKNLKPNFRMQTEKRLELETKDVKLFFPQLVSILVFHPYQGSEKLLHNASSGF